MADRRSNTKDNTTSQHSETAIAQEELDDLRGRGWHGNPEGHAEAGRKGGQTVAQNRAHMAAIGRKGGQSVSQNRSHMAEIGRRGGQSRGTNPAENESSKGRETRGGSRRTRAPQVAG